MQIKSLLLLAQMTLSASYVAAHGFMAEPRPRAYNKINYLIDDLRNPAQKGAMCRNEPRGTATSTVKLAEGQPLTVKLALSVGAEHIGSCTLELWDKDMKKSIVLAKDVEGCASAGKNHNKGTSAKDTCSVPEGLVTNDMCLKDWTITVPSLQGLDFTEGVLRWQWTAKHISPPEFYENCADVKIEGGSSSTAPPNNNYGSDNANGNTGTSKPEPKPAAPKRRKARVSKCGSGLGKRSVSSHSA